MGLFAGCGVVTSHLDLTSSSLPSAVPVKATLMLRDPFPTGAALCD